MNDNHIYMINTDALFNALNTHRKDHGLTEIDHPLIASKLGILFALKTNGYVNFKGEFVEIDDSQLIALQEILEQHFNANMIGKLRSLILTPAQVEESMAAEIRHLTPTSQSQESGLFKKIKGLFKSKVQERHA
jgi:hypothetical protein